MSRAEERALEAYPIKNEWVGNQYGSYGDINEDSREKFIQGYEQAEKDFMEKAEKWLKSCLDKGCWVANNLCDYDKQGIVQGFKEMMYE